MQSAGRPPTWRGRVSRPTLPANALTTSRHTVRPSQATNPGLHEGEVDERVAVVAKLLPGSHDRAAEILARGAPYGLALAGFRSHSVFLADEAVIFAFAGPSIERLVRDLVNDRSRSAEFGV